MKITLPAVQNFLQKIPAGRVATYGDLARALGTPRAAHAVGRVLGQNPAAEPGAAPCHRVVRADGRVGGFALGTAEKIRRLRAEGVRIVGDRVENFPAVRWGFL